MSTPEQPSHQPQLAKDILVSRVESYTREEPAKAVSAAFGAGILLALFPVGSLVSAVGSLVLLVARPFLIILGLVKLVDEIKAGNVRGSGGGLPSDPSEEGEQKAQ